MSSRKLKIAILISGRGSNMLSILEACKDPAYPAEISVVLSNNPDAPGLETAQKHGIATEVINHKDFNTREEFDTQIQTRLQNHTVDLIVLAGFMRILTPEFVEQWPSKIINIHPSLLPDYKGTKTHERVIADGKTESGCTVHFVIPELDSGAIIIQKRVPVTKEDTPETLANRVLEQEHLIYPEAVKIVAEKLSKLD